MYWLLLYVFCDDYMCGKNTKNNRFDYFKYGISNVDSCNHTLGA
jgi:hypothetical protein